MPIDIFAYPPRSNNPFEIARRKMISKLAALKAPTIGSWPTREDFGAVIDHAVAVTEIANEWLTTIGIEVRSNSTVNINMDYFTSGFSDYGVNGWCLYEIERCAEALEEEGV
jgi:hypothetical protein